jgi:hypothetical protein
MLAHQRQVQEAWDMDDFAADVEAGRAVVLGHSCCSLYLVLVFIIMHLFYFCTFLLCTSKIPTTSSINNHLFFFFA